MRQIINGKIYDTATMTILATNARYANGNYCGEDRLCRTKTGELALVKTSNGQDLYRQAGIEALTTSELGVALEGWAPSTEETAALREHLAEA